MQGTHDNQRSVVNSLDQDTGLRK